MTFDPGSGHLEVLRRHVEKHDVFKARSAASSGLFPTAVAAGAAPTLVIAASDSLQSSKDRADLICDGTADEVQIQAAATLLATIGGRILLSEGSYALAAAVTLPSARVEILGIGFPTLTLAGSGFTGSGQATYKGLRFTGGVTGTFAITNSSDWFTVHDCIFESLTVQGCITPTGSAPVFMVTDCRFDNITLAGGGGFTPQGIIYRDGGGSPRKGVFAHNEVDTVTFGAAEGVIIDIDGTVEVLAFGNTFINMGGSARLGNATFFHNFLDHVYVSGNHADIEHDELAGLSDDDHTQYLTSARHDIEDHSVAAETMVLDDLFDVTAPAPATLNFLQFESPPANISVLDVTRTVFATDTTEHLCDFPATTLPGNLLILAVTNDGTITVSDQTTPAGWTKLSTVTNPSNVVGETYWKEADGSEGGGTVDVVTLIAETMVAHMYRVDGWNRDDPPEIAGLAFANDSTPDTPSLDPSWGAEETLWIVLCQVDDFFVDAIGGAPTNYATNFIEDSAAATNISCKQGSSYRITSATSEDPDDWTGLNAGDESITSTIGIRGPASAAGIWVNVPDAKITGIVDVDQADTAGAVPVITLDQADVDEDFFKFIGTSDTNVDRALVDAANFTTPGAIVGWLKINLQDDQGTAPIVDGDYYIPFYAAPTA